MTKALIVDAREKECFDFGGLSVRWKVYGKQRRALLRRSPPDRAEAPPHHHNEDELSYVLAGRLGAPLGDDAVTAKPGTWVFKPRKEWHTFWSAGKTPCEITEYALEIRFESVPDLCQRFGLTFPAL